MSLAVQVRAEPPMSAREFRAFQHGRPDEERWELVDGRAVMMTPPLIDHNRIASNLERLLNDALAEHEPSRIAVQRPGVDLGLGADILRGLGRAARYVPEPDVAVIFDEPSPDRRFIDQAFLLAEIASSTDDHTVTPGGEPWIEAKARLYRAHAHCEAVLVIEQRRIEVRSWVRDGDRWTELAFRDLDDALALPAFGLSCKVREIYRGTYLNPRLASHP